MAVFVHDTRDQAGKHEHIDSYLLGQGHKIVRSKLYAGDITLLNDQSTCIDIKGLGMQEVYGNIVQSHDRFKRECVRSMEAGIRLVVLVEEYGINGIDDVAMWENPRRLEWECLRNAQARGKWLNKKLPPSPPIPSDRLMAMMKTMTERYEVEWDFCTKANAGRRIEEILLG